MKREQLILTLSWVIVVATLLVLVVTLNKFGVITGQATDTGEANLTITAEASISFTDAVCDFGSGSVDEDPSAAELYSNSTNVNGSWTNNSCDGLTFSNDGNTDIEVNLSSDSDASDLIGGTSPAFEWAINDDSSCSGTMDTSINDTFGTIANTGNVLACSNITYVSAPTMDLDFHLTVPEDAPPVTASSATITATGTAI